MTQHQRLNVACIQILYLMFDERDDLNKHERVCGKVFLLLISFRFLGWVFYEALPDDHKPLQIRWQVVERRRLEGRHACRGWAAVVFAQGLHLNRSTWNKAKKKHKRELQNIV